MGETTSSTPASCSAHVPNGLPPPSPNPKSPSISLPLTTSILKLHNSSHSSLPPPIPPPTKPAHVSQRRFYANGSKQPEFLATLYSPPHHHYNSMEIFLASVVGLIASVLLATHSGVDNVLLGLPFMLLAWLCLSLAIVKCIENQATQQALPTNKQYNPNNHAGRPCTYILKMTFFTICLLACMTMYEFITIMRLLVNPSKVSGHHLLGVILTLFFVPLVVGLSCWFGLRYLRKKEISYMSWRHSGSYDEDDPIADVDMENNNLNSEDDMRDGSFEEIEKKQRRLSNPEYDEMEMEVEVVTQSDNITTG